MLRTDELLLAHLLLRRSPSQRVAVKAALRREPGTDSDAGAVARGFMRAKLLAASDFVALSELIASARRRCPGCGRTMIVFPGSKDRAVRDARCGARTPIPAWAGGGRAPAKTKRRVGATTRRDPSSSDEKRIGPYTIESTIAQGGMGIVYKAFDARTKRRVALKVLRGDASADMAARFKREAEAIARLRHPSIVSIHDVGLDGTQRWFTMDLIEGEDLEKALSQDALSHEEIARAVAEVAEGLDHAHERGIIHRDVKPQNILVETATGAAKLTDFGLARDLARSALTDEGDLIGTPLYMAPEQLNGTAVDRRTDVYALGLVLYRALAGGLPYAPKTIYDLKEKVLNETPPRPSEKKPGVPPELERICWKAIEKDAGDRYESASALARDLRAWERGDAVLAKPVSPLVRAARTGRRFAAIGLASVLAIAVFALGFGAYDSHRRAREAETAAQRSQAAALDRANGALAKAGLALEEGKVALTRGDPLVARARFDASLEALVAARAALPEAAPDARRELEPRVKGAERSARRARLEARLASGAHGPAETRSSREEAQALLADDARDAETLLLLGRIELESDRLPAAIDALGRAIDVEPARLDAYYLRGEAHRRAGRAEFAAMDLARALGERAPQGAQLHAFGRDEVLVARVRARLGEGDKDGALRDLEEAARAAPRSASVHLARAELLRAKDDLESALVELSLACGLDARRADLLRERGRLEAVLGDRDRALEDLDAALKLDPRDRIARTARARLRALALDTDGADEDLAPALGLLPDDPPDLPAVQAARLVAARLRRSERQLDEALVLLDAIVKAAPRPTPATLPAHLERAEVLVEIGSPEKLEAALGEVELVLAAAPGNARAYRAAARLALASNRPEKAKGHLERILELDRDKKDGIARALMARTLRALGDQAGAARAFEEAARVQRADDPRPSLLEVTAPEDDARELADLGLRALKRAAQRGGIDAAVRAFQRARSLAPELARVRLGLADSLSQKGLIDDALKELDRALLEAPPLAEEHVLRAELLLKKGERDEPAIEAYGTALDMVPADDAHAIERAAILLDRGRARLRGGDARGALADLDRACALDPVSLDAFRERARAHERLGDAALAKEDRARVEVLAEGYRKQVLKLGQAWEEVHSKGRYGEATEIVDQAFNLVPREDKRLRARLYYSRAFFSLRDLHVGRALVDLAAMVELDASNFKDMLDEIMHIPNPVKLDSLLAEAEALVRDREPDPDYFAAFEAFVRIERSSEYQDPVKKAAEARRGTQALGRYLDRKPVDPSGLTLRALLEPAAGLGANALRDARAALEVSPGLGPAEYALFRVYLARKDRDAALAHLDGALKGRFLAWSLIDADLGEEKDARFKRLMDLTRGRDALDTVHRAEQVAAPLRGVEQQAVYEDAFNFGTGGLVAVARLVRADDPEAREIAALLRIERARCSRRMGDAAGCARDVVAAFELSPATLPQLWRDLVLEAQELVKVGEGWDGRTVAPLKDEAEPSTKLQVIGRALVLSLGGAKPRNFTIDAQGSPALLAARSVIRLAGGDPASALADANEPLLVSAAPLTSWLLAARAEAARGRTDEAVRLLAKLVAAGVPGTSFKDDPVLDRALGDDAAYRKLVE